jgi:hypothetical protein
MYSSMWGVGGGGGGGGGGGDPPDEDAITFQVMVSTFARISKAQPTNSNTLFSSN